MRLALTALLALASAGCQPAAPRDDRAAPRGGTAPYVAPVAADNTGRNDRDRDMDTLTPGDQAENDVDRTITQQVRQQVVGRDDLSMSAANIKIITAGGVVTLRGPVRSEQERTAIYALAQSVSNVRRVENQLEIAAD